MVERRRAVLTVSSGPNDGDTLSVEQGTCRLIGRHLSESETTLIDRDGNRLLDGTAVDILSKHLKDKAPPGGVDKKPEVKPPPETERFSASAFERGPDIIFADDSISRAHAMVFFDNSNLGIVDLASTNGTFVNTERVSSALIHDGDSITIGNSDMTVKLR